LSLVIPLPVSRVHENGQKVDLHHDLSSNTQELIGDITFSPNDSKIGIDEVYGNKYAVWDVKLSPGETKVYEMSFKMAVSPAPALELNKVISFDGYGDLSKEIGNKFCSSNGFINADDARILAFVRGIRSHNDDVLKVMKGINSFVIKYLDYGNPISGLYTTAEALEKRRVDCGGFTALFTSLAVAIGVPCRIVSGFWAGYKQSSMHAWAEFMIPDGRWIAVDPSVEQLFLRGQTVKSGHFGYIGSDRIAFSTGCDIPIVVDGKKIRVDILQNPLLYPIETAKGVEVEVKCESSKLKS